MGLKNMTYLGLLLMVMMILITTMGMLKMMGERERGYRITNMTWSNLYFHQKKKGVQGRLRYRESKGEKLERR
jgi:hypothetical protein